MEAYLKRTVVWYGGVGLLTSQVFRSLALPPKYFRLIVQEIEVKRSNPRSHWVWGAITSTGEAFRNLKLLWDSRHRQDEYLGHLLNAYIGAGNTVRSTCAGEIYMDVGTLEGYHQALNFLRDHSLVRDENPQAA